MTAAILRPTRRRRASSVAAAAAVLVGLAVAPRRAEAADADDRTLGRIDGDLAIAAGLGAALGPREPRLLADARLRYLSTVGVYGTYEDAASFGLVSDPRRVVATGLELRPLFFARWLRGIQTNRLPGVLGPRFDLFVDSFALELGVAFQEPARDGRFRGVPGLEAGLGVEVPLFPSATGLFLGVRGKARFSDRALGGLPLDGPADRALVLGLTLGWQQVFRGHVVDAGDPAP